MMIGNQTALHAARLAGALHASLDAEDLDFSLMLSDSAIYSSIEKVCSAITGRLPDHVVTDAEIRRAFFEAYIVDLVELEGGQAEDAARYPDDPRILGRLAALRDGLASARAELEAIDQALEGAEELAEELGEELAAEFQAELAEDRAEELAAELADRAFEELAEELAEEKRIHARYQAAVNVQIEFAAELAELDTLRAELAELGAKYAGAELADHGCTIVTDATRLRGVELARLGDVYARKLEAFNRRRAERIAELERGLA